MKKTIQILATLAVLVSGALLPAAEPWEGSDDFSNPNLSLSQWYSYKPNAPSNYQYVYGDQMRGYFLNSESDNPWFWGANIHKIPTAADWTVSAEVTLPNTAPPGNIDRCKAGFAVVTWPISKRVLLVKMRKYFDESGFVIDADLDYASGKDDGIWLYVSSYSKYRIRFSHSALNQLDNFTIEGINGTNAPVSLFNETFPTQLHATPLVALATVISGKPNWPLYNTTLGLDNWSVEMDRPAPITFSKSGSVKGVNYSVVVKNLELANQRLTGQVDVTVGGVQGLDLPISGTIDKKGLFNLTASTNGFGCSLQYNKLLGTFTKNKNQARAPGVKPVKF